MGEKSNLQSQLAELQGQLRNKNSEPPFLIADLVQGLPLHTGPYTAPPLAPPPPGELSDLGSHLHATRQKLEEIEREKLTMSEEGAGREKVRMVWDTAV